MIISDTPNHKVDVSWSSPDRWLQITTFHKKGDTEWATKTIRLSPECTSNLLIFIGANGREV